MSTSHGPRLDRRGFIGSAAAAAGALVAPSLLRADRTAGGAPAERTAWRAAGGELTELTLAELADGLTDGRWTSRELVEACLARIDALNAQGPELNAVLEVNPEAIAIAAALDAERAATGPRSRLHGLPILVKDSIDTADALHTSAGSLALAGYTAPHDATVIERLRRAGCIILGKSNMSEWSNARGRSSIAGWSARGRLTRNPHVLDRTPGGSSSGTAAAVAARLVPGAIGVEALGSIVSPASICGVVGLKPTVGLVSRRGIIPVSLTQDTAGPMCRTVRDAALLLSAMAGPDPQDEATLENPATEPLDYTTYLDARGLKGARIGVARNLFGYSIRADRIAAGALDILDAAGARLIDPVEIESVEAILPFDAEVIAFELKAGLNHYLRSAGDAVPVKSLAQLIDYNRVHSDTELKWFGQETFEYAASKGPLASPEYRRALQLVRGFAREQGIDATMDRHRLDAIVAPAQAPAWLIDMFAGDNTEAGAFVASAAAGYPSISVPAGDIAGLPVGLLFMGRAWSEPTLLRLAYAFEQAAQVRTVPTFQPELPLER